MASEPAATAGFLIQATNLPDNTSIQGRQLDRHPVADLLSMFLTPSIVTDHHHRIAVTPLALVIIRGTLHIVAVKADRPDSLRMAEALAFLRPTQVLAHCPIPASSKALLTSTPAFTS